MLTRINEKFIDFADFISSFMGTPANILFWLLAVVAWFILFGTHPSLANSAFLPNWFTSNSFNFPLNSITTLAELYIGFLIAAAANRVEKRNREMMEKIALQEERILKQEGYMLKIVRHLEIELEERDQFSDLPTKRVKAVDVDREAIANEVTVEMPAWASREPGV